MNLKCPVCHARFSIEQLTQDEAARELLGMRPSMLPSLMPYLTLFRTGKRDLAFDKALQLVKEVAGLGASPAQLEHALSETVTSIKAKRDEGQFQPLKNHNYLKKVFQAMPVDAVPAPRTVSEQRDSAAPARSKTASAIGALEQYKRG
jgi:hypothetical protein